MQRPASGQRRRSVAQAVLAEHSPWLPSRSEAEREALLNAPRRYQLFWAGRASGRKGFRGDLFRFHTDAANKLRDGWLLHDTSHKHTPPGAATAADVKQRGWFAVELDGNANDEGGAFECKSMRRPMFAPGQDELLNRAPESAPSQQSKRPQAGAPEERAARRQKGDASSSSP